MTHPKQEDALTVSPQVAQAAASTRSEAEVRAERARKDKYRRKRCAECDNWRDPPSDLCPGCQAYRDHTGHF